MSTLRNAVKRKEHKERAQPAARRKYGLLEKHKDYVERAKDYHRKEDHLQLLREKASFRNPDEFYFSMENAKTKNGVHIVDNSRPRKNAYSEKQLEHFRKTDMQYVKMRTQVEMKKMERLRTSLQAAATADPAVLLESIDEPESGGEAEFISRHVRFDEEEPDRIEDAEGISAGEVAVGSGVDAGRTLEKSDKPLPKRLYRQAVELKLRNKRFKRMKEVEAKLVLQEQQSRKGRRRKVKIKTESVGDSFVQHVWKKERLK